MIEGKSEALTSVKMPYGEQDGRYWISGTRRDVFDPDAEDAVIQIQTIGIADPPAEFEGWCDLVGGDGGVRRVEVEDGDPGNNTRVVRGQEVRRCEVRNIGGRGTLRMTVRVDGEEIFDGRAEAPDVVLTFDPRREGGPNGPDGKR